MILPKRILLGAACIALLASCGAKPRQLRLVTPTAPVDRGIIEDVADLLAKSPAVRLELTETPLSEEAALAAVASGDADLALVTNNLPFRSEITTVMPLYPTVLHMGHGAGAASVFELESGRTTTVYAGPEGSASRLVFERVAKRLGLGNDDYRYVDGIEDRPDIVIVFAPISPARIADVRGLRSVYPEFEISSMGSPEDIGKGTLIDAAVLLNPHFRPFVIPAGTYDEITPNAVVTVAVDKILVARQDLDSAVVYELVNEILRLRPALSARRPGLFQQLAGDFDVSRSAYLVHPGTQAYLQRDAPSIYERYSGIAEVVVTLIVALASASFAGLRIYRLRRKNRIDVFYTKTIALRRSINESSSGADVRHAIAEIRELQANAFDMLVDEKLAADESFRIFITLSNDALRELGESAAQNPLSDR